MDKMDKDEILFKARAEGAESVDEGTKHTQDKGRKFAQLAFCAVYLIIATLCLISGKDIDPGVTAMFMASVGGELFSQWRDSKKFGYLLLVLLSAAAVVFNLIFLGTRMFGAGT